MHTKDSPARALFEAEVGIQKSAGIDPAACDGLAWLDRQTANGAVTSMDDLRRTLETLEGEDTGAWASRLLAHHWDTLYPKFRTSLMQLLHGDNCLEVVRLVGGKLSKSDKVTLRQRFFAERDHSGREPSGNIDVHLDMLPPV